MLAFNSYRPRFGFSRLCNFFADFLQFTFPAGVPVGCFCGCFGVQVRPKSLTFPGRTSPKRAERTSPVQVNHRRYPELGPGMTLRTRMPSERTRLDSQSPSFCVIAGPSPSLRA